MTPSIARERRLFHSSLPVLIALLVAMPFSTAAHAQDIPSRAAGALQPVGAPASPQQDADVIAQYNVMVPMRDGVRLSTDIYRPAEPGRYPVILMRDAYGNGSGGLPGAAAWVKRGYVYIKQDVRGRYDSDGRYYPYVQEVEDGYDAQQWAGGQAWSNGNVGMIGSSYRAAAQWLPAHLRAPALKAIIPTVSPFNYYRDVMYIGGAYALSSRISWGFLMDGRTNQSGFDTEAMAWHLPLQTMDKAFGYDLPHWRDWIAHPSYDDYWQRINVESRLEQVDVPALNIGGWYDVILRGTLAGYEGVSRHGRSEATRRSQRLVIGPWHHFVNTGSKVGELDFGADATIDLDAIEARWMAHWLKQEDTGLLQEPPVRIFVMGENRWRDENEWPLARARHVPYYFQPGAGLEISKPGQGGSSEFTYDPADPVPTLGGNLTPVSISGPKDQAALDAREDILRFSTSPLQHDLEVTGPISVVLYASSSAPDTDFTAKLLDVHPDGKAYNLADGIIRARYRESFEKQVLLEPGKVYAYTIDLWATSNLFKRGHRIRIDVSSSNFPRFDRNPNTGHAFGQDAELRKAEQVIHYSRRYPSHVLLPVIPR